MEEFKQRLLLFIDSQYGSSLRKFEEMCGLSNGIISSIKVKGPSADIVSKISDTCPQLNLNWLFRGEAGGAMLNGGVPTPAAAPGRKSHPVNVENVQAVFITNWGDIQSVVENVVKNALIK